MADYYVSHHASASDSNGGTNDTTDAWATIQYGLDNTTASDTLWVKAGQDYVFDGVDQPSHSAGEQLMKDTGGGVVMANTWCVIRGYTGSPGSEVDALVTLDGNNALKTLIYIKDVSNVIWKYFKHINVAVGSSVINGIRITSTASQYNFIVDNCIFDGAGERQIRIADTSIYNVLVSNCIVTGSKGDNYPVNLGVRGQRIINCDFDGAGQTVKSLVEVVGETGYTAEFINCNFHNSGVLLDIRLGQYIVKNCTFYDATDACIDSWISASRLIEYNNIFHVADPANDYAIRYSANLLDVLYSGYSCTNANTNGLLNKTNLGEGYIGGSLNDTDPQFVDAESGDFRTRNPAVVRGGKPDIDGNPTQMGAVQRKYRFAVRGRMTNRARLQIIR